MRKLLAIGVLAGVMTALCGCIGSAPVGGFKTPIVAEFKAPLSTDVKPLPPGNTLKTGRASTRSYMSLVSSGDMSIAAAMKNGGITNVTHIDYEYRNVAFFMYQEMTIIVHGS